MIIIIPKTFLFTLNQNENVGKKVVMDLLDFTITSHYGSLEHLISIKMKFS